MDLFAEKCNTDEGRQQYEHRREVEELYRDLNEKDVKCEEMVEQFQAQLKVLIRDVKCEEMLEQSKL